MEDVHNQQQALLAALASACSYGRGFGSMSPSIYDTAWLSMVQKPPGSGAWLFPESFRYVLDSQLPSGAWESYATTADGILNTSAALLALRKRLAQQPDNEDWALRSRRAEAALKEMLQSLDASCSDQIGFELLVFKHLSLLAEEGVTIRLQGLTNLQALYDAKMAKISPQHIYSTPSTSLHSLEALIGHIDFDRIGHLRERNGSMLCSPSSTAAYLMHASTWDEEAEVYLQDVLAYGSGKGDGSVPCAWPTSVFEVSWVVTTLAQAGTTIKPEDQASLGIFLEESLQKGHGCVGFSPTSIPDSDDTAKTIMALRHLGKIVSVDALVEAFESEDHFRTYERERNPSFTSNCNVLTCLCMLEDPLPYALQISKAAKFLCSQVSGGNVRDKWHIHDLYWMMLLAQALERFYRMGRDYPDVIRKVLEHAPALSEELPLVSLKLLIRVLSTQEARGCWDESSELTSYAILTLASLAQLPWIHTEIHDSSIAPSIGRAKSYLARVRKDSVAEEKHLWIEKVTYTSDVLSRAYRYAAISMPITRCGEHCMTLSPPLQGKTVREMRKAGYLITKTPLLAQLDGGLLQAAELQASYILRKLERQAPDIFTQQSVAIETCPALVPLTWAACDALQGGRTSLHALEEMIHLSMLVYQTNEYFEAVVERDFIDRLDLVRAAIRRLFGDHGISEHENGQSNGHGKQDDLSELRDVEIVLGKLITHILQHPAVRCSPAYLQDRVALELQAFLLANTTQAEENINLRQQTDSSPSSPGGSRDSLEDGDSLVEDAANNNGSAAPPPRHGTEAGHTFYQWVRGAPADHTSCPLAFAFFHCLAGPDVFASARTAYAAEDLCRHLANLCRLYGEYACVGGGAGGGSSATRFFPASHHPRDAPGAAERQQRARAELMWIAEYERLGLSTAAAQLEGEVGGDPAGQQYLEALRLFVDVTDLYAKARPVWAEAAVM